MKRRIEADLEAWKDKRNRLPLLLYGARQVGKTHLVREFGRTHYDNVAYVNLETNQLAASYFEGNISPQDILTNLEAETGERIVPGRTLIILDEVQSSPRALTSLKYFAEQAGGYHVVAAGSLLGVAVNREQFSFPVGNVESVTLHPLDFEEYLWAAEEDDLSSRIRQGYAEDKPLPEALHARALSLYREYLVVGGMPRAVVESVDSGSLLEVPDIQRGILNDYSADMAKYATESESVKIRAAFDSIPAQLAKDNHKFQYKVAQRGGTAAVFGAAVEWLGFAGVAMKCNRLSTALMPLAAYMDLTGFKLYMGDTGLLTMKSGLPMSVVLAKEEVNVGFLGALTENYVAQALTAAGHPLYYWASDGRAEVDFVLQLEENIVPVEVKAGQHTRSRSLSVYMDEYRPEYAIRLSTKNFGLDNRIKSVPLYAAYCIR
ncbi:MAG: ATP-binding protein [Propionibacteriaceae bacterium]|jgi:predicted AAA+ superfamily ATPase|nr:ATP-binding protein [Propionibacteriaceae bacterium]